MGSLTLAYPSLTGKTTGEQMESMRRYLCTLTDQLNLADWSAGAVLREVSQAIDADSMTDDERRTTISGYAALKALVIKTADFAAANSEEFRTKLSGNYVAVSDFGKYWEEATMTVEGNEFGIRQLYDYAAGVNNAFTVNAQQYVKTGLLYYDGVTPVYGVGVGNIATTVTDDGGNVIDKTQNELVTVTPGRVSFWQDGDEVAYLSGKKLHFPSGTLEATNAVLSGTLTAGAMSRIGPWTVSQTSIYFLKNQLANAEGLYFGVSGLSVKDKFKVDAEGNLTATGVNVSGTVTASSLYVGGVDIATQLNYLANTVYSQLSALMSYVTAQGQYSGNLAGDTISVGTQGTIYAGTNSVGTAGLEVYGMNGLRLSSGGNVYLGAGGGGANGSITIGGGQVSIYASGGLYVNGTKVA